jgi:CRP-like cAMP-binding protein
VALLNESARTATITAESDLRCYGLTSWEFRPLVETHGSIAWKLLQAMSKTYQS